MRRTIAGCMVIMALVASAQAEELLAYYNVARAEVAPVIFLLGFTGGAFLTMHSYLNSRYFDAAVIGQVTGAQMPLFLPFGLLAPPLAGYVFDQQGNYHLVFSALSAALVLAAILAATMKKADDEISAGTSISQAVSRWPPARRISPSRLPTSQPKPRSMRSLWSRVGAGSWTTVSPRA